MQKTKDVSVFVSKNILGPFLGLAFSFESKGRMDMDLTALFSYFRRGQIYVRSEVHDRLGGQRQGGISTPRGAPGILLFRREQAAGYEHSDGWSPDGFYHFSGEGPHGDMHMTRGNRAIRDHRKDGKVLALFESVKSTSGYYRFEGFMNYVDYYRQDTYDLGNLRRVFVFRLTPIEDLFVDEMPRTSGVATTFLKLRPSVFSAAENVMKGWLGPVSLVPDKPKASVDGFFRRPPRVQMSLLEDQKSEDDEASYIQDSNGNARTHYLGYTRLLQRYILERANGFCESCGRPSPFKHKNNSPYLEVHHIDCVGDDGMTWPRFAVALCPTCHKKAHYGAFNSGMAARLYGLARDLEDSIDKDRLKVVAAAIIRDDEGRILVAQKARGDLAGLWKFPGGQVEIGETLEQGLVREVREELSLNLFNIEPFLKTDHDYETFYLRMYLFLCRTKGTPVLNDHLKIMWHTRKNLSEMDWAPADEKVATVLE